MRAWVRLLLPSCNLQVWIIDARYYEIAGDMVVVCFSIELAMSAHLCRIQKCPTVWTI